MILLYERDEREREGRSSHLPLTRQYEIGQGMIFLLSYVRKKDDDIKFRM